MFDANVGKIGLPPAGLAGKMAGFFSRAGGMVQDLLTLYKETPIGNPGEIRTRLIESIGTLETEAKALVFELQREAARTWRDYLQPRNPAARKTAK